MTSDTTSRNSLSRRHFMALGGAGLVAGGTCARAFAQTAPVDLTIQLNWLETGDFAPMFAAELKGFDLKHGIRQSFIPGGPQVDPVQSVAGGAAPVGIAATISQSALARAAGIPIKIIGAFNRTSPLGLLSLADNPIRTPQDCIGKRIGLQGGARMQWSVIMAANGMTESQMTIVPVAGDLTPLVSKQVDGFWGTAVNQHIALQLQGIENHIMLSAEVGAPEHFEIIIAMESSIRDRRDDIAHWLAAMIEGQDYYRNNTDEVATHIVDRSPALKLNLAQQKAQVAALTGFINVPGNDLPLLRVDEDGAIKAMEQLVGQGKLPADLKLHDFLDYGPLDDAYKLLG